MSNSMRKITAVFWIPAGDWSDGYNYAEDIRGLARLADQGAAVLAYSDNVVMSAEEAQEDEDWSDEAQERFYWKEEK